MEQQEYDILEERFTVTDDQKALWCIRKIKEAQDEADRFTRFYQAQIKHAQEQAQHTITYMQSLLEPYFDSVPRNTTKTQESYTLPGARLIRKAQDPTYERDEAKLLAFLKASGRAACIKVVPAVEKPSWADYKPLTIVKATEKGPILVDKETGEVVSGVTVTENPPKFEVKIDAI